MNLIPREELPEKIQVRYNYFALLFEAALFPLILISIISVWVYYDMRIDYNIITIIFAFSCFMAYKSYRKTINKRVTLSWSGIQKGNRNIKWQDVLDISRHAKQIGIGRIEWTEEIRIEMETESDLWLSTNETNISKKKLYNLVYSYWTYSTSKD